MSLEIKHPFKANERIDLFPRDQLLIKDQGQSGAYSRENVFVKLRGYNELQLDLMKLGISANLSTIFVQILWRAGPHLERSVSVSSLARDVGKKREAVSRDVATLQSAGLIVRRGEASKLSMWEFPIYQELMSRAEAWVERKAAERKAAKRGDEQEHTKM